MENGRNAHNVPSLMENPTFHNLHLDTPEQCRNCMLFLHYQSTNTAWKKLDTSIKTRNIFVWNISIPLYALCEWVMDSDVKRSNGSCRHATLYKRLSIHLSITLESRTWEKCIYELWCCSWLVGACVWGEWCEAVVMCRVNIQKVFW